jgi:hypothetical protein
MKLQMVLGSRFTFQMWCHLALVSEPTLPLILDLILIPTVHLGVTFTIAFVLADLVLVLTWHALLTSATVSLSPFS